MARGPDSAAPDRDLSRHDERRARRGRQHPGRLSPRPAGFRRPCRTACARPAATTCAAFLAVADRAWRAVDPGAQAVGAAPVLWLSLCRRHPHRRSHPDASPRPRRAGRCPRSCRATTWTRCWPTAAQDQTPEGLRLTLIVEMLYGGGLRVSELAGMTLAAVQDQRRLHPRHRQGQQGTADAAEPRGARRRWMPIWRCATNSCPRHDQNQPLSVRLARRGRLSHPPALSSVAEGAGAESRASIRPKCRRMCCAMPSPPIWWKAARTCAACRRCWAMPTSPPPRSIPMWRATI